MERSQYQIMRQVEDTHYWYVGMRQISTSLLNLLLLLKQSTILDAGCGTGGNIELLAHYGHVTGIDISPHAIKFCLKRGYSNIYKSSIDDLPFKKNTFDLITCFDVLGHSLVDQTKAMSEFYRTLKPGGFLLLRTAANPWLYSHHDHIVQNKIRFTQASLLQLTHNFSLIRITHANFFLFPLIAAKRLLSNLTPKRALSSDTYPVANWINYVLTLPLYLESLLLRYFNFPFGVSLIIILQKPPQLDKLS